MFQTRVPKAQIRVRYLISISVILFLGWFEFKLLETRIHLYEPRLTVLLRRKRQARALPWVMFVLQREQNLRRQWGLLNSLSFCTWSVCAIQMADLRL